LARFSGSLDFRLLQQYRRKADTDTGSPRPFPCDLHKD
jgi:hypothetical protein